MELLLNYLGQASTWRGILGLLTAVGVVIKPELADAIIATGLAVMGLVNVIRNEKQG